MEGQWASSKESVAGRRTKVLMRSHHLFRLVIVVSVQRGQPVSATLLVLFAGLPVLSIRWRNVTSSDMGTLRWAGC